MMEAQKEDIYEIIKTLGFANNKAINLINMSKALVERYSGIVPNIREELETLPGVGRKTANVVLAVGFDIPAFPVDTHLIRMYACRRIWCAAYSGWNYCYVFWCS